MFWDPGFTLSNPDTFVTLFPFFAKRSVTAGEPSSNRLVQEKLAHHLDLVEVDIAEQVAQKSHHFFEVGLISIVVPPRATYHTILFFRS